MSKKRPHHITPVPDPQVLAATDKSFKGYTMEELRYQKALALLRKEFCKSNVLESVESLRHPFTDNTKRIAGISAPVKASANSSSAIRQVGSVGKLVLSSLLKGMKPLDYVMFGISLIGPTRKLIKSFRKK